jgi:hypothetical protein
VNATEYTLRGQFDKLLREKNEIMLAHRTSDRSNPWQDCYYTHPSPLQMTGFAKRVEKLATVDPALYEAVKPILQKMMVLAADICVEKDKAAKEREARKQAAAHKKAEATANKINPYRSLHPEVAKLLREVAAPYRKKAYEQFLDREENVIKEISERAAACGSFRASDLYPIDHRKASGAELALNGACISMARPYLYQNDYAVWRLRADSAQIAQKIANELADDLVNAFVLKVGTKLSGLVEKKGNLSNTAITGSLSSHWMTLDFADGSSFQVQSQIVWKTSYLGTHFAQYPTCFRNVKLADGSKMELPSEAKMKEQFV